MKSALLRDICKAVGIQIIRRDCKKEFALVNNLKQLVEVHSAAMADKQEKPKTKRGKVEEVKAVVTEEDLLSSY